MSDAQMNPSSVAGAIGMVNDRSIVGGENLCNAWLLSEYKAATIASAVVPFSRAPHLLSVSFPKAEKVCGITKITFHPKFELNASLDNIRRGLPFDSCESTLQKYNCAILHLTDELPEWNKKDLDTVRKTLEPHFITSEGFSGLLKNIDLSLLLQTIKSGRQEGILYLCDEIERPLAQLFFQSGNLISARFKNLSNEQAIYQIVQKGLDGKFIFRECDIREWINWLPALLMREDSDKVLADAMKRKDDLAKLRSMLQEHNTYYVRAHDNLEIQPISEELRNLSGKIWKVLDGMNVAEDLWLLVNADDYMVFRVLEEMFRAKQIKAIKEGGTNRFHVSDLQIPAALWAPLPLGPELELQPYDQLTSIALDIDAALGYGNTDGQGRKLASSFSHKRKGSKKQSGSSRQNEPKNAEQSPATVTAETTKMRVKNFPLLGAIDAYDSSHLLHEIPLLPCAGGSPIFKDGLVVGMQCGAIPSATDPNRSSDILNMMIWIDEVEQCLKSAGEMEFSRKFLQTPSKVSKASNMLARSGCQQIAYLKCPECGQETFASARACEKCKYNFLPLIRSYTPEPEWVSSSKYDRIGSAAITLAASISTIALIGLLIFRTTLNAPDFQSPQFVFHGLKAAEPNEQLVKIQTLVAPQPGDTTNAWTAQEPTCNLNSDSLMRISLDALKPSYIYLLHRGRWSKTATLLFPEFSGDSNLLQAGTNFKTKTYRLKPPDGSETVVLLASKEPQDWLKDPDLLNSIFQFADHLPPDTLKTGMVVTLSRVDQKNKEQSAPCSLFISARTADHLTASATE